MATVRLKEEFLFQSAHDFAFIRLLSARKSLYRDKKTKFDFETAIRHCIDGVRRKYIPYWAPSLRDSAEYGIYFLPTSRQYKVVLPS